MAKVSIKWISHAGFIITSPEGKTVIIDPWITDNPLGPIQLDDGIPQPKVSSFEL